MNCPSCNTPLPSVSAPCPFCGYWKTPPPESTRPSTAHLPVRKIGFGEAIRNFFKQYATFSGRATRSEYWYMVLFNIFANIGIWVIFLILPEVAAVFEFLYNLAILIPSFSIVWRRLHDIGRSGGWYFILLVPLVGWIILLVFLCTDSKPDNRFGPRKV